MFRNAAGPPPKIDYLNLFKRMQWQQSHTLAIRRWGKPLNHSKRNTESCPLNLVTEWTVVRVTFGSLVF